MHFLVSENYRIKAKKEKEKVQSNIHECPT